MRIKLPEDPHKTVYDYTLSELLTLVEKQTGKELAELIYGQDYSLTFPADFAEREFVFEVK